MARGAALRLAAFCAIAATLTAAQPLAPVLPIVIANGSWPAPKGSAYMGDIRAVVQVAQPNASGTSVQVFWRRRDNNPEVKTVLATTASGSAVPVLSAVIAPTCGIITVNTSAVAPSSTVYLYYLPYNQAGGGAAIHFSWQGCTNFSNHACVLGDPATGASTVLRAAADDDVCESVQPSAAMVTALETRNAFHGFTPMELMAASFELTVIQNQAHALGLPFLVYPDQRVNTSHLRNFDWRVPIEWAGRPVTGAAPTFVAPAVSAGEYFTFQLGLYAYATALINITAQFSDLTGPAGAPLIPSSAITCFNLGGVGIDGVPFNQSFTIGAGNVGVLWVGVDLPADATAVGVYTGTVTVGSALTGSVTVALTLNISGPVLPDHGDADVTTMRRLRWLDSTRGLEDTIPAPFVPVGVTQDSSSKLLTVTCLNKVVQLNAGGMPMNITIMAPKVRKNQPEVRQRTVLAPGSAMEFALLDSSGAPMPATVTAPATVTQLTNSTVAWTATSTAGTGAATVSLQVEGSLSFFSYATFAVTVTATGSAPVALSDMQLRYTMNPDILQYMVGMGPQGGNYSDFSWRWSNTTSTNKFWSGSIDAGLLVNLKGDGIAWDSPMFGEDFPIVPFVPPSWGGADALGAGNPNGANITNGTVVAFSGPRTLAPGASITFLFDVALTPSKVLNMTAHWGQRYFQVGYGTPYYTPQEIAARGATVVTLHQGTPGIVNGSLVNPYIDWPFAPETIPLLANYTAQSNELGMATKFYYTVRELTNHATELFALLSLNGEVMVDQDAYAIPQPGYCQAPDCHGGEVWLHEHVVSNYTYCWQQQLSDGEWDASLCDKGVSRWFNYYSEGLYWSFSQPPFINGLYTDGSNVPYFVVPRMRRAMDAGAAAANSPFRPLLDVHTGRDPSPPACSYVAYFPFTDSVWNGEGFDFSMGPEYWLVEVSSQMHGLTGDRLGGAVPQDDFKGMLFGMTQRNTDSASALWQFFDASRINQTVPIGFWEEDPAVTLSYTCSGAQPPYHTRVLATAYVAYQSHAILALASFCPADTAVTLQIDWDALGLDPATVTVAAPAIPLVQPAAANFPNATGPFTLPGGSGMILVLTA